MLFALVILQNRHKNLENSVKFEAEANPTIEFCVEIKSPLYFSTMAVDRVGNSLNRAKLLRVGPRSQQRESIGLGDLSDYYRFQLHQRSAVQVELKGLKANADLTLLSSNRQILQRSRRPGRKSEAIVQTLTAGTYFLHISTRGGQTAYRLITSVEPALQVEPAPQVKPALQVEPVLQVKPALPAEPVLQVKPRIGFNRFSVTDASGDYTANTLFQSGALRWSYSLTDATVPVRLEAWQNGSLMTTLATSNRTAGGLVSLASFPTLNGNYQVRAVASSGGQEMASDFADLKILPWDAFANTAYGTFSAETLFYNRTSGGQVVFGRGGTDTLSLQGIDRASITSLNGQTLDRFDPFASTSSQAVFQGTAYDYLTLADGRELYFQGIEALSFADGSLLELQVRSNDPHYGTQWNLHTTDVDSAWRFSQGSDRVLLVSLDTGILTTPGASGGIVDLANSRLLTDPSDDDNFANNGHGHQSISIMAATPNNAEGIAGINWRSQVRVADIYHDGTVQQAIAEAVSYARSTGQRLIFQGGMQTDYWLTHGGTQAQLEALIRSCADIALFAIAAGNGGPGGGIDDPDYLNSVSGIGRLETTHTNVLSVGAAQAKDANGNWTSESINGLLNATSISLAPYSNRGSNLTIVAPTDSPAMDKYGSMQYFAGTSGSNPNLAGIASLLWSVNPNLSGAQVRQILTTTATDIGTPGRDTTFGAGLVNADAAVRRAWAIAHDGELANLYPA